MTQSTTTAPTPTSTATKALRAIALVALFPFAAIAVYEFRWAIIGTLCVVGGLAFGALFVIGKSLPKHGTPATRRGAPQGARTAQRRRR